MLMFRNVEGFSTAKIIHRTNYMQLRAMILYKKNLLIGQYIRCSSSVKASVEARLQKTSFFVDSYYGSTTA